MSEYRNLLIGCGHARDKRLDPAQFVSIMSAAQFAKDWRKLREWRGQLETLDYESPCKPDIVWNLNATPWPVADDCYDEIHAYEVLEHLGRLGDFRALFETFTEVWRALKPGGFLCATVPSRGSSWFWGDPGHTRPIQPNTLIFLDQRNYVDQQGRTTMSDYRSIYRSDLETVYSHDNGETHQFILRAVKPSRWAPQ